MRIEKALIVASREYLARLKSKAFWIATLLMPVLMLVMMFLPSLLADRASAVQELVVAGGDAELFADLSAELFPASESSGGGIQFNLVHQPLGADVEAMRSDLDARLLEGEIDAWIWLGKDPLTTESVDYHAESTANVLTQSVLRRALNRTLRQLRLVRAGFDPDEVANLTQGVSLNPVQVGADGDTSKGGGAAFLLALFLILSLYMGIIMYGQAVLNGVLEEKSSRVVEVMLSAVSSTELMLGKLIGICGAALTQMVVWLTAAFVGLTPGLFAASTMLPEGIELPSLPLSVVFHFLGFFLLGFGIYAAFYATLGAAFNNVQEAQQMAVFGIAFLIMPMLALSPIINDPDSKLSVIMSLIPMFSPLVMVMRIAVKTPPAWQIALSYLLTTAFMFLMISVAAKVYRTGILMYGKKPTFAELWRWVRHA